MLDCLQIAEKFLESGIHIRNAYSQYSNGIVEFPNLGISLIVKKPEIKSTIYQPYQITPAITRKYPFIDMPLCDWTVLPPGVYQLTAQLYYFPFSKVYLIDLKTKKVSVIQKSCTVNISNCSILAVYNGRVKISKLQSVLKTDVVKVRKNNLVPKPTNIRPNELYILTLPSRRDSASKSEVIKIPKQTNIKSNELYILTPSRRDGNIDNTIAKTFEVIAIILIALLLYLVLK